MLWKNKNTDKVSVIDHIEDFITVKTVVLADGDRWEESLFYANWEKFNGLSDSYTAIYIEEGV